MRERDVETKLTKWCKANGVLTYKFTSPSHRGVPDRLYLANGRTLYLELKAPGKKPTKLQLREIERIRETGNSADWADTVESAVDLIERYLLLK